MSENYNNQQTPKKSRNVFVKYKKQQFLINKIRTFFLKNPLVMYLFLKYRLLKKKVHQKHA